MDTEKPREEQPPKRILTDEELAALLERVRGLSGSTTGWVGGHRRWRRR
jgi:hypothetical protein